VRDTGATKLNSGFVRSWKTWKSHEKNLNHKGFEKVIEICYNHVFIYAEFEIINMFLKKDAQNISQRTLSIRTIF